MTLMKKLLSLSFLLFTSLGAHAAITVYTDQATFLAQLHGGYYSESFSSLTPGDLGTTSLNLSGGLPPYSLTFATRNASNTFAGDNLYLADLGNVDHALGTSTTLSDLLQISSIPGFTAIGGEWFLGDLDDNYVGGTVRLTFSDNSFFDIFSTTQANSFRGFISDVPLVDVRISGPGTDYVTVDNLIVGTPEPSRTLLLGIAFGAAIFRRQRRQVG